MIKDKNQIMRDMKTVLNHSIKVYGVIEGQNELLQETRDHGYLKTIPGKVIPQTGKVIKSPGDKKEVIITHKIKTRYHAGKDINRKMYLKFRGIRFNIKHILNDRFDDQYLEIFVEEVQP